MSQPEPRPGASSSAVRELRLADRGLRLSDVVKMGWRWCWKVQPEQDSCPARSYRQRDAMMSSSCKLAVILVAESEA